MILKIKVRKIPIMIPPPPNPPPPLFYEDGFADHQPTIQFNYPHKVFERGTDEPDEKGIRTSEMMSKPDEDGGFSCHFHLRNPSQPIHS
jgi:hypothetical protein